MAGVLSLLSWLAFPLYVVLGLRVRARTPRFPPPPGPVDGHLPESPLVDKKEPVGKGPVKRNPGDASMSVDAPIQLLVLGDSSAAAVGLARQEDGLAPQLAAELFKRTGRGVTWRIAGFNSATAGDLRSHVVHNLEPVPYTHILLSVGFNDLKNFHSRRRFLGEFGTLIYALKARFPQSAIYWPQMLEPDDVPGLPRPLAAILEMRRRILDPLGCCVCRERGAIAVPAMRNLPREAFCSDGIHPSEQGFRGWAVHLADWIVASEAGTPSLNEMASRRSPRG